MPVDSNKSRYFPYLLITIVNIAAWFPSLYIRLFNDDYQIILWIDPKNLADAFRPFWESYVIGFYWRPLPAVVNTLSIFFAGNNPFVFHLLSLIAYIIVCILLYKLLVSLKISKEGAIFATLLFSVLPSHEMAVAWLSARNDTIALIFILSVLIYFIKSIETESIKKYVILVILLISAFLSKEAAFPVILIFPAYFYIFHRNEYQGFNKYREFLIGTGLIIIILLFRWLIVGSQSIFSTSNLASFDFVGSLFNFAAYIPLSFINADTLEGIYSIAKENIFITIGILLVLSISIFLLAKKIKINNKNLILFGAIWFLVFVITALPLLGRWYAFIPSVGLIIIIAVLYEALELIKLKRIIIISLILMAGTASFIKMTDWVMVSVRTEIACKSFGKYNYRNINSITLLGAPNKIDNINSMRIGVQEMFHYFSGEKQTDVLYPLKSEIYDGMITLDSADGNYILKAANARFLAPDSKSYSYLIDEERNYKDENIEIRLINRVDGYSKAYIRFKKLPPQPELKFYFDGKEFRKF
jgi:hypothetical protein